MEASGCGLLPEILGSNSVASRSGIALLTRIATINIFVRADEKLAAFMELESAIHRAITATIG